MVAYNEGVNFEGTNEGDVTMPADLPGNTVLGQVDPDRPGIANERLLFRMPADQSERFRRNQWVRVHDGQGAGRDFLGRIVGGPFFLANGKETTVVGEIE